VLDVDSSSEEGDVQSELKMDKEENLSDENIDFSIKD
jgi:hypothetical protein